MSYLKEKIKVGKNTVYMFDPQIYPRKLWISITKDTLEDRFEDISEWKDEYYALVSPTRDKVSNFGGFIIRFGDIKDIRVSTIAHESGHIAFDIFQYCDIIPDPDNQEPFCYLIDWVAECCEEVYNLEK